MIFSRPHVTSVLGKFYESPWHDLLVVELLAFLNFSKRTAILVKLGPQKSESEISTVRKILCLLDLHNNYN